MSVLVANAIVVVLCTYAAVGLVFALAFVWTGIGRLDPMARAGSVGFRLAVLPGVAALWPLLAGRWARARRAGRRERT